ncbi:hypothetical protein MTO96_023425 [Rhipicephalus appendiculatus]
MVAADLVNKQSKAKRQRKATREILKQRRRLSEYFTLVREMRLGDGRDYFEYFRMSVERFLAHGSSMTVIAKSYRICDSAASKIFRQTYLP